ncbi:hypothetical protein [uncultured Paraglaciecola sp.]|jgi:hypothetical protein|uniref:hypothetical protein n=1 Tax=uncultured Paraglaciecola sp. TaxID=1765024 RepID=UPI0025D06481|nr:hypothetical protein [uncultured Paraglaciecola sp.]
MTDWLSENIPLVIFSITACSFLFAAITIVILPKFSKSIFPNIEIVNVTSDVSVTPEMLV